MFFQYQTAKGAKPVTKSDTVNLDPHAVAVYVTVAGSLHVLMHNNDDITFPSVPVGPLGIAVKRVFTDSTADVIALTHK